MSQQNVEVVRQILEEFNRRDWAAWESHHHREVEWCDPAELPGGGVQHGVGEIRRFFDEMVENEWQVEVDDLESVGHDRVLMRGRSVFVGRVSGVPIEAALFQLFELDGGRVHRIRVFRSSTQALEAAGLSE